MKEVTFDESDQVSGGWVPFAILALSIAIAYWGWRTRTDISGPTAEWKF
jgi:hypothetical protein